MVDSSCDICNNNDGLVIIAGPTCPSPSHEVPLSPPCLSFLYQNGIFLMHLWLLGHSLDSRPGLCLAALLQWLPQLPRPTPRRRRRRRRIRGGGTRNLLSLPEDNKDNDGGGGGDNEGATPEPILSVSHDQSCFAPGSTTILTLVDRPLPEANDNG